MHCILFVGFCSVDLFFVCLGWKLQHFFRQFSHVKSYNAEIIMTTIYTLYWVRNIRWILKPILEYLILTSDYECSDGLKQYLAILYYFAKLMAPFGA
jgi:hypothetical protein